MSGRVITTDEIKVRAYNKIAKIMQEEDSEYKYTFDRLDAIRVVIGEHDKLIALIEEVGDESNF